MAQNRTQSRSGHGGAGDSSAELDARGACCVLLYERSSVVIPTSPARIGTSVFVGWVIGHHYIPVSETILCKFVSFFANEGLKHLMPL